MEEEQLLEAPSSGQVDGQNASGQADKSGRTDGQERDLSTLSVDETAALLSTTARNVRRYIAEGKLPAIQSPSGRGRLIPKHEALLFQRDRTDKAPQVDGRTKPEWTKRTSSKRTDKEADGQADKAQRRDVSTGLLSTLESDKSAQILALTAQRDAAQAEAAQLRKERDREREEVEFLRARVAELNAVVMQTARAIPSQTKERPIIETAPFVTPSAPVAPANPPGNAPNPQSQEQKRRGHRREARPLWAVILGIRPKG